jgi:1-deoxy-D-xylulose-5-phosphate synthase
MAPKDENELARMLITSLAHKGPIAVRYPRGDVEGVKIEKHDIPVPIGKGKILQKGNDVLILAIGRSVSETLAAHSTLAEKGISATVVNCRFVKPLDADLIGALAREIPRIITVEENVRQGGFGSAVLECLSDQGVTGFHLQCIGIPDSFVEHGPQKILRSKYGIDASTIVNAAKRLTAL